MDNLETDRRKNDQALSAIEQKAERMMNDFEEINRQLNMAIGAKLSEKFDMGGVAGSQFDETRPDLLDESIDKALKDRQNTRAVDQYTGFLDLCDKFNLNEEQYHMIQKSGNNIILE